MPDFRPPFRPLLSTEAFAVSEQSVQIAVRGRSETVEIDIEGVIESRPTTNGAAAFMIEGLNAATRFHAHIRCDRLEDTLLFSTAPPIGPVLTRFATISDLHLGRTDFGIVHEVSDEHPVSHGLRCALAAVRELQDWGAEFLILKGDITEHGSNSHWAELDQILEEVHIPVFAIPGNHDSFFRTEIDPCDALAAAGLANESVQVIDRPGIRVILGDTSIRGRGMGSVRAITDQLISAAECGSPTFIGIHHNIQRTPVTWFWPPGITSMNAKPLLAGLAAANRNVFISSGHTHRHRRHRLGPDGRILYTEVGSTSDYPGTWAGYEVSDTTIRQTVHRIAGPDAIEWTEATRRAVGGIWPRWSQGALDDRCVDLQVR